MQGTRAGAVDGIIRWHRLENLSAKQARALYTFRLAKVSASLRTEVRTRHTARLNPEDHLSALFAVLFHQYRLTIGLICTVLKRRSRSG
jgi:hypothetical protein